MIDRGAVLSQNCMDLQKDIQGFCSEMCSTSRDASQIISPKVKDVSDTEEEEVALALRYLGIKAEHAVILCLCVTCRQISQIYKIACYLSHLHVSVHMKPIYSVQWIFKRHFHNLKRFYIVARYFSNSTSILS
jgi:predicted transcriptional regulator